MRNKLLIIVVIFAFLLGFSTRGFVLPNTNKTLIPEQKWVKNTIGESVFPRLDLPVNYFSNDDVHWGSVGNGNSGKITDYTQVSLKNKTVYQSYPTMTTTIKSYSNEVKPLKIKSFEEAWAEFYKVNDPGYWETAIKENYQKYGSLSTNYLPTYIIEKVDKFDVDEDGIPETIVTYNFAGRADGGSYMTDIIKGNNIIFSVQEDRSSIIPADTINGFYVEWGDTNESGGRCCPEGFYRTRFIFKDNKFEPIYEQEVKYLKIGKME